jgi:hypothetical protein
MATLFLYTTLGCHLCETAEELIIASLAGKAFQLVKVEIAESDDLMDRYGLRIPVLALDKQKGASNKELGWPFDGRQVLDLWANSENG